MNKKLWLLVFGGLLGGLLSAQKIDLQQLEGLKMRNIGPAGMSGRVTAIDVNPQNEDHIYVGTASGGVWESKSGGVTWQPIFDDQPVQSIGALAVDPINPSVIWVGTGEGNPRNSLNTGEGIFKSIDGGRTWKRMGLEKTRTIHRIIVHPHQPNTVYVAALGSPWGPNEERGVFKTADGGNTWDKVLYINDLTGCADLVVDPVNPNKVIAAMWEHERKPWFFNSGGKGSGLYMSYDGGENWKRLTSKDGLPKGDLGRIGLAIAPSKPDRIYALVEAKENALYRSDDGGHTWKKWSTHEHIGNRPFYYSDIFVDPSNENRLWSLYSLVSVSEDGGKTFRVLLAYSGLKAVHPDHHAFWISSKDPNYIIEGNDGGLNISRDGGESWRFVENLPVGQFYHVNIDTDTPYNVYGGMQDNGSWVGPAYDWKRGGIRNADFQEVMFGDGFDVMPHPNDNRYLYAMYQGGNVGYVDTETGKSQYIRPYHSDGEELRFNWNAAIAQNPYDDCGIYFGSQYVHKSMDCGQTWEIISPDLTTNDTTKQNQEKTGGLTIDNTRAENHTTILTIAPSIHDEQVIWVGTDDGNLQITRDGGANWQNLASRLPGFKAGSWIPQITLSEINPGEAFVVVNDYRRNDYRPMLYHTKNYGTTFTKIADERKVEGHALSVVQDPEAENLLFLGTDYGLYVSFDYGRNWNKWMNGYPAVPTMDLKIHPREHDLVIGTFGRSFWVLDDIRPLRAIANDRSILKNEFKVFPAPDAYLAEYRSIEGTRFVADGEFVGDNRRSGAMITVWYQNAKNTEEDSDKEVEKKPEKAKKDKATVKVYDVDGELIRTFSTKLDTGMNRVYWNLSKRGVRFPSYREVKKDADEPSGMEVMPGTYKLVVHHGNHKDSTEVRVLPDPRLPFSKEDYRAKMDAAEEVEALVTIATEGFNRLSEAEKTIAIIDKNLLHLPDTTQQSIKKTGGDLKKTIADLQKKYAIPPTAKGIQRSPDDINGSLYTAYQYLSASPGAPTPSATAALNKAKKDVQGVLDEINAFFNTSWKEYEVQVKGTNYQLFKEYDDLKTE